MQANVVPFQKVLISQVLKKIDYNQKALTNEKTKRYPQSYLRQFIHWIYHTPVLV
jgi:chromate reductase